MLVRVKTLVRFLQSGDKFLRLHHWHSLRRTLQRFLLLLRHLREQPAERKQQVRVRVSLRRVVFQQQFLERLTVIQRLQHRVAITRVPEILQPDASGTSVVVIIIAVLLLSGIVVSSGRRRSRVTASAVRVVRVEIAPIIARIPARLILPIRVALQTTTSMSTIARRRKRRRWFSQSSSASRCRYRVALQTRRGRRIVRTPMVVVSGDGIPVAPPLALVEG